MELIQKLPDWDFVGGSTQSRTFQFTDLSGIEYDMEDGVAYFAVQDYVNGGSPVFTKQVSVTSSQDGNYCAVTVSLDAAETADMSGRFVYQVTVQDSKNHIAIPFHGRMQIVKNIAPVVTA